jgi:hypothetical protein
VGGDPYGLVICMGGGELAIWDNRERPVSAEELENVLRERGIQWPLPDPRPEDEPGDL